MPLADPRVAGRDAAVSVYCFPFYTGTPVAVSSQPDECAASTAGIGNTLQALKMTMKEYETEAGQ